MSNCASSSYGVFKIPFQLCCRIFGEERQDSVDDDSSNNWLLESGSSSYGDSFLVSFEVLVELVPFVGEGMLVLGFLLVDVSFLLLGSLGG